MKRILFLQCIATGSSGNCYLLHLADEEKPQTLIIELGIPNKDIFKNLSNADNIVGAIYTHNHGDHNYKVRVDKRNSDVFKEFGITVYGTHNLKVGKKVKLGDYDITALPAVHDIECLTYLIEVDGRKIYFATDTNRLVKISGCEIDTFVVEVNHSIELMNELLSESEERTELDMQAEKSSVNHMALETVCNYFEELEYKPKRILTIHGSGRKWYNKEMVKKRLGKYSNNVEVVKGGARYVL